MLTLLTVWLLSISDPLERVVVEVSRAVVAERARLEYQVVPQINRLWAEVIEDQTPEEQRPAIHPLVGRTSSLPGMRIHPVRGNRRVHWGLDIAAPRGTPVRATGAGQVVRTVRSRFGLGNHVVLGHPHHELQTVYGHLDRIAPWMVPGRPVERGQLIGWVGSTGLATGPHVHYEVRNQSGVALDPRGFLAPERGRVIENLKRVAVALRTQ